MNFPRFIVFLIVLTSCVNQKAIPNFEGYNAKPQKVESIQYFINDEDTSESILAKRATSKYVEVFNKKGRKTKILYQDKDGVTNNWINYKYALNGELENITFFYKDSSINYSHSYEYYKNRKLRSIIKITPRDTAKDIYSYKKVKNNIEITITDAKASSIRFVDIYNVTGRKIESRYFKKNKLYGTFCYEYDNAGNKISESFFDANNTLIKNTKWIYDRFGNDTFERVYDIKENKKILEFEQKCVNVYDAKNNLIKSTVSSSDSIDLFIQEYFYFY